MEIPMAPEIITPKAATAPAPGKPNPVLDAFLRNWQTTTCGIVSAVASFVVMFPQNFPPPVHMVAQFAMAGGLAALGICGKDSNKSHTQL